jgi:hypothetical protein
MRIEYEYKEKGYNRRDTMDSSNGGDVRVIDCYEGVKRIN